MKVSKHKISFSRIAMAILVAVSLGVSAISACACAHHMPKTQSMADCHSSEHGILAESGANAALDVPCNCGEADSITAITVRNESVRFPVAALNATEDLNIGEAKLVSAFTPSSDLTISKIQHWSLFKYRSGPSRAPPRA